MEEKVCLENKVVVRKAEAIDLPEIYLMVDDYADGISMDKVRVKNNLREMLYMDGIVLAVYNDQIVGGIAGFILPCMFRDEILFSVMFFYMRKGYRHLTKQFIKELELCLLVTETKLLTFSVPESKVSHQLKRFFKGLGYKELETHFYKRL